MDRIVARGVRFTKCIATSPECIPTRISLATGLYPHNTGVWGNIRYELPSDSLTWMQAIRACGYRTSLFGKTHWHPHAGDLRTREHLLRGYGFDDVDEVSGPRASVSCLSHMTARWQAKGLWDDYRRDFTERFATKPHLVRASTLPLGDYYDVYVGQQALEYLREYNRAEPWFCWVSFPGPHEPWDAPAPYADLYDPARMPRPISHPPYRSERPHGHLDRQLRSKSMSLEPREVGELRANYAGSVTLIDDQIGQILDVIDNRGETDRTVILFTSDHGEMNGDHGLLYKSNFLKSAVQIPLVISTPNACSRQTSGTEYHGVVESIDIGPTLAELVGATIGYQQFGKSLCSALDGSSAPIRLEAVSEIVGEIMLMNDRWKIGLNADGEAYMLFDLRDDPEETNNLAGLPDVADTETELQLKLLRRLCRTQVRLPREQAS